MVSLTLSICTKNEEARIGRCLDSVLRQKVLPDEVVVADYESVDRTVDIALEKMEALASKGCKGILLKLHDPGIGFAREVSRSRATTEVFMTTDGDAELMPDVIERVKGHFDDDPNVIMVIGAGEPEVWTRRTALACVGELLYPGGKGYCMAFRNNLGLRYKIMKTDLAGDDLNWHEDTQIWWDALSRVVQGRYVVYDPLIVVRCRMPTTGTNWFWKRLGVEWWFKETKEV